MHLGAFGPLVAAQDLGELGNGGGQLEARRSAIEIALEIGGLEGLAEFADGVRVGVFVADADDERIGAGFGENQLGEGALLIADQAVAADDVGVEIDLNLGVFGDGLQRAG